MLGLSQAIVQIAGVQGAQCKTFILRVAIPSIARLIVCALRKCRPGPQHPLSASRQCSSHEVIGGHCHWWTCYIDYR